MQHHDKLRKEGFCFCFKEKNNITGFDGPARSTLAFLSFLRESGFPSIERLGSEREKGGMEGGRRRGGEKAHKKTWSFQD